MTPPPACSFNAASAHTSIFTGKERDTESGNDYFGARYYSSAMGRFMSPDPSGLYYADPSNPQSMNLYSYALNNPLKNTDPTGMYCYYGDTGGGAQEDADKQDGAQWDYHSSQSECAATDENGNQGQWINDDQTHQTSDGDWVDNDNRPDNFTLNVNTPPGGSYGTNQGSSWWPNFTVQVGLSVNLQLWGPLTFTGFTGYLIDSHGHVGEYHGAGGGFSVGTGASAGVQGSVSDGRDICAMGGPFTNLSGTVGGGVGGTIDTFAGNGNAPGGVVTGAGGTLGLAGGASGSAMVTGTTIKPFGGHTCVNGEIH